LELKDNAGISIIICCYNSSTRLPNTIKHIAQQQVPENINWELIIVNNNSTDKTSITAQEEISKHEVLLNKYLIVDEPRPGLSSAREKGVNTANYEFIIFCDDDNWLDKNYVQIAYNNLSNGQEIAAIGGQSTVVSNSNNFPNWWEEYKNGYAVGKQAQYSQDITWRKYLWGSGLAFKKSIYRNAFENLNSLLSDRKGNTLSSGGDTEICMRFILMGYKLYYNESLLFKHYIEPQRIKEDYRDNLFKSFGKSSEILGLYSRKIDISNYSTPYKLYFLFISSMKFFLSFFCSKWDKNHENNNIYLVSNFSFLNTNQFLKIIKHIEVHQDEQNQPKLYYSNKK
jgi:glycosyltransferase involved in cell wall biosynthesis